MYMTLVANTVILAELYCYHANKNLRVYFAYKFYYKTGMQISWIHRREGVMLLWLNTKKPLYALSLCT